MKQKKYITLVAVFLLCVLGVFYADENPTSVELSFSINWTFGSYKETTFSNITQELLTPRFQLGAKIHSGNFMHKISADYYFTTPKSAMTQTSVVYKNFDPVTGETYYEGFKSSLAFHRIRLQYDLTYNVFRNDQLEVSVGGNIACNAYLQFENYPSITGLFSLGPSSSMDYKINDRNSLSLTCSLPFLGYGVRPPYAGCDAQLMKYAEEDFLKILTLGNFLSLHNHLGILFDFEYKLRASDQLSIGMGFNFECTRIAVPKERPLYYSDGNFKTFAAFQF